jgi:hypothetical protein
MPHPSLTYDDFYSNNPLKSFYRNLSLSIAISKDDSISDSLVTDTSIGVGFRTLLFRGHDNPKFLEKLSALQAGMLDATTEAEEDSIGAEITRTIQTRDNQPFGFSVEIAGAVGLRYPENNTEKGRAYKGGAWVTPAYRPASHPQIQLLAVFRWLTEDAVKPRYDLGCRFLWFVTDRLAMSLESVNRFGQIPGSQEEDTYRVAGVVDYRLDADMYLTATFGRNFQATPERTDDLIASLGISFDFGDKPRIEIPSDSSD